LGIGTALMGFLDFSIRRFLSLEFPDNGALCRIGFQAFIVLWFVVFGFAV